MEEFQKPIKKRPFLFKVLAFSLLLISLTGWLRFTQSLYQWQFLVAYGIQPGPLYIAISGCIIGLTAGLGLVVFWLRIPWSKLYIQISLILLTIGWWSDYLLFTQNNNAFSNLPFRLVGNFIYLGFVFLYIQYAPAVHRIGKSK
jgi:hypothetical protein